MPYGEYFKASSESLVVVNRDGRIVEANPTTERLFGYSQNELIGRPVEMLIPDRLGELHRKHVADFFKAPRTRAMGIGMVLKARRKDGADFPVEVSLTYARGTPRGDLVVAALTDITQRLALETEVRRAETVSSLGMLAAGIAHDLNNPLQVIRSRTELLRDGLGTTPASEMREDLDAIFRQAQRAGRIVEEFLELSRHREKALAPVDLNDLVDRALLLIGEQIRKGGITIEVRLDRTLPDIVGDGTALERVLINLLTNARDAMPDGGVLLVGSGLMNDRPGWLHLTVADNGRGIPAEQIGKIFDLLYTTKTGGTGLGLWLSKRIVAEHSGSIDVQSEPGRGTRFTVKLPASDTSRQ
jgi:PAS domain S-box-containing protein